ncbi:MAG: molybdate ABC transporter substrate-binding protein [Hyphomicrobiaceae bacterium]
MTLHRRQMLTTLACSSFVLALPGRALAAEEVRVLAAGAVQKPVEVLIAAYAKARPETKVTAIYDTVGALRDMVLAGDSPDLLLLSEAALKQLAEQGRLQRKQYTPIGKTQVGLCAPLSSPAVDISTPDKLKAVLLAAPSIAHADPARGATAGTHFRKVLGELGILDQVAPRITVVPFGGAIPGQVAKGEFALGVSQATEIVPVQEVRYLGPLPPPHALATVYGLATVKGLRMPDSAAAELAMTFLGVEGEDAFQKAGFER